MLRPVLLVIGLLVPALAGAVAVSGNRPEHGTLSPRRIVSTNLCADQYLLALADRSQIAGLTINATDPNMSAAAADAKGLRQLRGSTEDILALDPDLILSMSESTGQMLASLSGQRYRTVAVPPANSYAEILAQIRLVAKAIGRPARGEALIRRMNAELATISAYAGRGKVAAYYQRRGYLTGGGTLVDDLMKRVGLVNLADRIGKPSLSQLSLEQILVAQPDYLIVESATDRVTDQGTEMLHHPALAGMKRLRLAEAWTVCGGPAYVRAVRSLATQLGGRT